MPGLSRNSYLMKLVGLAFVYALLAKVSLAQFSLYHGNVSVIWPPSGLALAALLIGGKKYWPGVFAGAFAAGLMADDSVVVSAFIALGNTLEPLLGSWLLANAVSSNSTLQSPKDYLYLSAIGALSACASAVFGPTSLWLGEVIPASAIGSVILNWWQGDTLGIILVTPLILVWQKWPQKWFGRERLLEVVACFGLLFVVGQVIFLDWFKEIFEPVTRGYWIFILVGWAAVRFGRHGVTLAIAIASFQALIGAAHGVGFFAHDYELTHLFNLWFYIMSLTIVGMALALVMRDKENALKESETARQLTSKTEERLRLALTAGNQGWFDVNVQTGAVIVSPEYVRMIGYDPETFQSSLDEWVNSLHPDDRDGVQRAFNECLATGGPRSMEYRRHTARGNWLWISSVGKVTEWDQSHRPLRMVGTHTDISERKQAEFELLHFSEALRQCYEVIVLADMSLHIQYVNPAFELLFGYSLAEVRGRHLSLLEPDGADHSSNAIVTGNFVGQKLRRAKDGRNIPVLLAVSQILDKNGIATGLVGTMTDLTEQKKIEESLRLSASVFAHAQECIIITDAERNIIDVNSAFTRDTGYTRDEVLGKNPRFLQSGHQSEDFYHSMWQTIEINGHWSGELWNRSKTGEVYAALLTVTEVRNDVGEVSHYLGISSDITHIKQHQKELEHIAHHDALTGLPNRILLADRMRQAIAQARRNKELMAVCYLDLDGFKPINDSMGHDAGDQVLIEISKRISETIRGGDTVARLGGDEFVILLLGLDQADEYMLTLDRLLKVISQPIQINHKQFSVGVSIGVSMFPDNAEDPDTLLRQADQAMYTAKNSGKNQFKLFS